MAFSREASHIFAGCFHAAGTRDGKRNPCTGRRGGTRVDSTTRQVFADCSALLGGSVGLANDVDGFCAVRRLEPSVKLLEHLARDLEGAGGDC